MIAVDQEKEWRFDPRNTALMTVLGVLVSILSLAGFTWFSGIFRPEPLSLVGRPEDLPLWILGFLGILLLFAVLFALHELCHGLGFRAAGAPPRYGAKWVTWYFPVFYATTMPGYWMTKRQYLVMALAPTVLINVLGVVLFAVLGSLNWIMIFPMAMHMGACIGDWWMVGVILRFSPSTVEDTDFGFRYR